MANKNLYSAKRTKNDEFYTRIEDIERELSHYKEYFKGKTILCNCDDPRASNFFKYFALNFNEFELKKIITTCYKNQDVDLFTQNDCEKAVYIEYEGNPNDPTSTDFSTIQVKELKGDGDFRSAECVELLKQADIVVTNPPFSLFREYVAQLMEYNKKYSEGVLNSDKNLVHFRNCCWFTNLDIKKRHEDLVLYKTYSPEEFPKYENYDAINVDKTTDIPLDFDGVIGVPITFLDKYSPEQFEIVGLGIVGSCEFTNERKMEILDKNGMPTGKFTINAKGTLYRKHLPTDKKPAAFKDCETGELYQSIYARILIKRK